ncbi:MAG: ABC transporter permease [Candidatus Buchananbacteria bacterium]
MTITDIFEETYFALSANKARSSLTVLGIVIGIGAVIVMMAIGTGATSSIKSNIQSIGSNMITVSPGTQRGVGMMVSGGRGSAKSLKLSDAEAIIAQVANVKAVSPEVSGRYQLTAKGTNTNTSVVGVTAAYAEVRSLEMDDGSFITAQNNSDTSKVAVLGPTVVEDLFGEDSDTSSVIGQIIRIKSNKTSIDVKVVGVTKAKGGTGFGSTDNQVYVPLSTAQRFLSGNQYLTGISVSAADADSTTLVQEDITTLLLSLHKITDSTKADFSTINQADIAEAASSVVNTLATLLAAVAGISLVVGGIGIMNMMLTTVTERTKEIGLRKSIGAKGKDVSIQFLVEAITLTFLGGFIGVIGGWLVSYGMTYFNITQTKVSLFSVLLAFGVSAFIGIVFGYYPARRAAKLNPIDALRYE